MQLLEPAIPSFNTFHGDLKQDFKFIEILSNKLKNFLPNNTEWYTVDNTLSHIKPNRDSVTKTLYFVKTIECIFLKPLLNIFNNIIRLQFFRINIEIGDDLNLNIHLPKLEDLIIDKSS